MERADAGSGSGAKKLKMKKKKMKTKKSMARRMRITKTGKVLHGKTGGSHLKRKETKSAKRKYKKPGQLRGKWAGKVKKMLSHLPW